MEQLVLYSPIGLYVLLALIVIVPITRRWRHRDSMVCVSDRFLKRYAAGQLSNTDIELAHMHVNQCDSCAHRLGGFVEDYGLAHIFESDDLEIIGIVVLNSIPMNNRYSYKTPTWRRDGCTIME